MPNYIREEWLNEATTDNRRVSKSSSKLPMLNNLLSTSEALFIKRSFYPAKISSIELDTTIKKVSIYLHSDQMSPESSKNNTHIKLPSRLTGYEIAVFNEIQEVEIEDVELEEFSDEIEYWVLKQLKLAGFDSAQEVLKLSPSVLVRRTNLGQETIKNVLQILQSEFEE